MPVWHGGMFQQKTRFVLGSSRHCFDGIFFIGESLYTSNNLGFARFRFRDRPTDTDFRISFTCRVQPN